MDRIDGKVFKGVAGSLEVHDRSDDESDELTSGDDMKELTSEDESDDCIRDMETPAKHRGEYRKLFLLRLCSYTFHSLTQAPLFLTNGKQIVADSFKPNGRGGRILFSKILCVHRNVPF